MSKLDITLFNENKNHQIGINYFHELKIFFEECILSYNKFWVNKKEFYIEKKNKIINRINKFNTFISILISVNIELNSDNKIIKFIFDNKKYKINKNFKQVEQKNINLIELYTKLINILQNKITNLDKAIIMCKQTNIKNAITLLNNFVDDELKTVKKECIKLYSKENLKNYIKQNKIDLNKDCLFSNLCDDIIHSILVNHHNDLIQIGINLLIKKFI
jgi:hypothetical protein